LTRLFFATFVAWALAVWPVSAQTPTLVVTADDAIPAAGPAAPPPANSHLTATGNLLFFVFETASKPRQLWRTDSTVQGFFAVTDDPAAPELDLFAGWQGALYFRRDGGSQLWRSDGTVGGTSLLEDVSQGIGTPAISEIFASTPGVFLNADDGTGPTTWFSDGTATGTRPLVQGLAYNDIPSQPAGFVELAGRVYVTGGAPQGVWVTQGTPETTKRLAVLDTTSISKPVAAAGAIFFVASREDTGAELWRTDGTVGGETLVLDIIPGSASSHPEQLTEGGRYLYFVADDGTHGQELWRTDGTAAGTVMVKDTAPGTAGSAPAELTSGNGRFYFAANDGTHGVELWQSDGTPEGTVLAADIEPGSGSSNPKDLIFTHGSLWFAAYDATVGEELREFIVDHVHTAYDAIPGPPSGSPAELTRSRSLLYASLTGRGGDLWPTPMYGDSFNIDDTRILEGNNGTRVARLTVTRTRAATNAIVSFQTVDGSAVSGTDYVASSGTFTFAAGQASQFIDITINSDGDVEPNEAFFVTLSYNPVLTPPLLFDRATGVVIVEDDDRPVLNASLNVQATALSASSVNVTWTANAAADHYDVVRIDRGNWSSVATVTATSVVDTQDLTPGRAYFYTVRAYDDAGNTIGYGAADLVTTIVFDDDPLVARGTPIRRAHIEQLRTAVNALRSFAENVDPPDLTPVPAGAPVRAADILALRDELTALRRRLGLPDIAWTDPAPATVKAVHVQELRDAVR
jgi:ELWxxDGT repeat protein